MKTNVVMLRKMGQFDVKQRTKDGYFNATDLLRQWCVNNERKDIDQFLRLEQTKIFMEVLELEENLDSYNSRKNTLSSTYEIVKGNKKKGISNEYWMHPILFIKFAMWINPRFEYFVIKFVYDQLIEYRHSAGDNYKGLTASAQKFIDVDYIRLAKALNYVIFGKHENGIRQTASQIQLKELSEIQHKLSFAIDMGFIKSFDQLISTLAEIYRNKYLRG
jgi:hypothetical protein